MSPGGGKAGLDDGERTRRGLLKAVLAWAFPVLVILAVAAYFVGIAVGHADPPMIAVEGHSMRPTLVTGDLVVVEGVKPSALRVGDVIAVNVPTAARRRFDLPAHVVHRIVKITHGAGGLVFTTKGDNNPTDDGFRTLAPNIIGEVRYNVPDLGFAVLFFGSKEGHIFLGATGAVILTYFLLGAWENRRRSVQGLVETIEAMHGEGGGLRDAQSSKTLQELVSAVGEYGVHLKSHTAVMVALAETTEHLNDAVARLSGVIGEREAGSPETPSGTQALRVSVQPRAATGVATTTTGAISSEAATSTALVLWRPPTSARIERARVRLFQPEVPSCSHPPIPLGPAPVVHDPPPVWDVTPIGALRATEPESRQPGYEDTSS